MRRRRPQRPEQRGVLEGGARPPLHGDGGVAGSTGSALRLSPSSRLPRSRLQARRDAPEAPPTSRTEGGFWKGGPAPPCTATESPMMINSCPKPLRIGRQSNENSPHAPGSRKFSSQPLRRWNGGRNA